MYDLIIPLHIVLYVHEIHMIFLHLINVRSSQKGDIYLFNNDELLLCRTDYIDVDFAKAIEPIKEYNVMPTYGECRKLKKYYVDMCMTQGTILETVVLSDLFMSHT